VILKKCFPLGFLSKPCLTLRKCKMNKILDHPLRLALVLTSAFLIYMDRVLFGKTPLMLMALIISLIFLGSGKRSYVFVGIGLILLQVAFLALDIAPLMNDCSVCEKIIRFAVLVLMTFCPLHLLLSGEKSKSKQPLQ
jgi:hypothetical protein